MVFFYSSINNPYSSTRPVTHLASIDEQLLSNVLLGMLMTQTRARATSQIDGITSWNQVISLSATSFHILTNMIATFSSDLRLTRSMQRMTTPREL